MGLDTEAHGRTERRFDLLALEPWLRGSHERFLAQWSERSRHSLRVLGLPARDWKWRMRSSGFELARWIERDALDAPEVMCASDYVDVPALYGWLPASWSEIPCVLYFHENQLTYPLPPGADPRERDQHFGFTNILSALRAARVVFNSRYHKEDFARASDELLARLPRPNPRAEIAKKIASAEVIAPGVDTREIALGPGPGSGAPLRVLFNHRWEHDKDPLAFLAAAREVLRRGGALELVLLGETFELLPPGAAELLSELAPAIREHGFAADRKRYVSALGACDVVVSTARHEFFGVSVAEAMAAGCTPLVPRRLSYPELVPTGLHAPCLYSDENDLVRRLQAAAADPAPFRDARWRSTCREATEPCTADIVARRLDEIIADVALESEAMTSDTKIR